MHPRVFINELLTVITALLPNKKNKQLPKGFSQPGDPTVVLNNGL